jgi:hypothetical protein
MEAVSLLIVLATLGVDVGWITGADGRPVYSFRVEPELLTELRNGQAIVSAVDPVDQQNLRQFQIVVGKTDLTPVRTGSLNANGYYERSDMVQYGWKPSSTGPGVDYFVQISPERMESLSKGTPISDLVDPSVTSIQRFYIFMGMETLPRELPAVSTTTAQPATATATTPPAGTNAAFGSPSGGGTLRGVGSPTLGNATPIGFGNMQTGTNPSTATTPTYPGRLAPSNTTSGGLNNGGNIYSTNTGGNTSGNPSGAVGGNLGGNWQSVGGQNTNPDHFGTGGGNFSTGNQQLSSAGTLPVPPLNDPNANYGFGSTSPANVYRPADPSLQANAGLGNLAGYSAGWQQNYNPALSLPNNPINAQQSAAQQAAAQQAAAQQAAVLQQAAAFQQAAALQALQQAGTLPGGTSFTHPASLNTATSGGPAGEVPADKAARTSMPLILTTLTLFASLGANAYLGWLAWSFFWRFRESATDLARVRSETFANRHAA